MRHVLYAVIVGILMFGAREAAAASFDCKKAASTVEHSVCDDPELNSLDSQLQGAYLGALDRSNHPDKIKEQQRAWLKQRDSCADPGCLSSAYTNQIQLLSSVSDEPPVCAGPSTPEVNECMSIYSNRADRELDRYVAAVRARLQEEMIDDPERTAPKDALADFDAGQAAWVVFRKAECNGIYDWWSEGTIRGAMFESCWQTVTKSRTMDIWSNWLGYGDNTPPLMPKPVEK